MAEELIENKPTHMDEFLKIMVVDKFKIAIDLAIAGRDEETFRAYKALFHLIEPYEFEHKETLVELTNIISEYIKNLKGRPVNKRSVIEFNNQRMEFRDLVQVYMSEIPRAYAELGLWFRVVPFHHDLDRMVSDENFNSNLSKLEEKRKVLLKLDLNAFS